MRAIIITIGVILIMIFGMTAVAGVRDINDEKTLAVNEIDLIQVETRTELITVFATDNNEAKFHVRGRSKQEVTVAAQVNNKTLVVGLGKEKQGGLVDGDLFLDIYIPKNYVKNLSLKTATGTMKVYSLNLANLTCTTNSGTTLGENLKVEKFGITTSSGTVELKNVDSKAIDIKGTSGKVMVTYKDFENQNLNVQTASGSILVELPATSEFSINARTNTGKLEYNFPIDLTVNNKKYIEGKVGTKTNKISLQAVSGSIKLVKK